ncbi:MAG: mannose-1-phosphate guanylyltransferase [Lachnospiraceae bacterium]|nr:mannose-1-phosphate guanylyltransferase [Lachnospiraceae bacterium]MCR5267699.1 NTP transferase domain-containing protein [Lachnospiraceae bacterium]
MKKTALIMAGGRGERFWPKSRKMLPKQFLSLTDDGKTMIQLTVERIRPLVEAEDIYIATNRDYLPLVKEQLPEVPEKNILCEPVGRNTAPCIALGAALISSKYEDALMMVLPSDHLIRYAGMYQSTLKDALDVAEAGDNLVTVGITPDHAETGYGYIKFSGEKMEGRAFAVERFVEKPSLEVAKEYLAADDYLWNSGMFMWKISSVMKRFTELMPEVYKGVIEIKEAYEKGNGEEALMRIFPTFPSISIDYGVMEKSQNIYTVPGTFGWDDVGSWLAVERIKKSNESGNIVDGNVITINTKNCIIQADGKLIATVGLKDLIIVDTEDATLICDKETTADIKKVLENLKICNRNEYL